MSDHSGTVPAANLAAGELTPGVPVLVEVLRSLVGASLVMFVGPDEAAPVVTGRQSDDPEFPELTVGAMRDRARAWAATVANPIDHEAITFAPGWQLLMAQVPAPSGEPAAALAVARGGQTATSWSDGEIAIIRKFAVLCGSFGGNESTQSPGPSQWRLDDLVTRVAVELMPVTATSLNGALESTLRALLDFFEVDTSYLRRNDFVRGMSVLVAEWPARQDVPDPDPLGEVSFDADPVFAATRDLREPFVVRPASSPDAYQDRVQQGSGIDQVSMAMVPLVRDSTTIGVLGFVKFGDRPWGTSETNALQAVASLLVQLFARIDAEDRLQYHAFHDDLTSLPNRRALLDEIDRKQTEDGGSATALFLIDLDRFKAMNDFLGHGAGDRLLVSITGRLSKAMSPGDFVARLAGDQFVFLLDRPTDERTVLAVAEDLLELVAEPIEISGHHITRTASLGIALGQVGSTGADDLLGQADAAAHVAKTRGGNQAVLFDQALRDVVEQRSETELLLRNAIGNGGLLLYYQLLYYQPEIDLRTGRLLAVEALVRWDHPQRGVLAAGSFIAVAEETGLIVDLGRWVMAEACRQMATWREQYPHLQFTMRVNMSPAQLATRNIVRLVADCLNDNHLPGRALCLEITEHAVMGDVEQAVRALEDLRALGVTVAIDDFGTGHSSMSQLKRLPVDCLKIDQTFVAGLGTDSADRAIVDATVHLARSFGLNVVAEGVETVEVVHELIDLGCHRAQGYLFSRPKPASELEPLLLQGGLDPATFTRPPPTVPVNTLEQRAPLRLGTEVLPQESVRDGHDEVLKATPTTEVARLR
jgi:diguanylate cyclase (GGDEF)-like protein